MSSTSGPGVGRAVAALLATGEMWPGTLLPLGLLILKGSALTIGPRPFEFQAHDWAWCAATTGIWAISTITVVARGKAQSAASPAAPIAVTLLAAVAFLAIACLETSEHAGHKAVAVLAGLVAWACLVPTTAHRVREARWDALR